MQRKENSITLGIETAVRGGSICLLSGELEIDGSIGGNDVSRSEDLISSIAAILKRNSIAKTEIDLIAISTGPGSYTGIRVGMAAALGLKNSLIINCTGVQVLEAMYSVRGVEGERSLAAVPIGRDQVCWQVFSEEGTGELRIENEDNFIDYLASSPSQSIIAHSEIHDRIHGKYAPNETQRIIDAGECLAVYVAKTAKVRSPETGLVPVYTRELA